MGISRYVHEYQRCCSPWSIDENSIKERSAGIFGNVRKGVEDRPARHLAGNRLILKQGAFWPLLQWGVYSSNGDHKPRCLL